MTKAVKIAIGVAAILILAGAVLVFVAFAAAGFDTGKLGSGNFETKTYEPEGAFDTVEISVRTSDVDFYLAEDGVLRVECYESEEQPHTVAVADGKLTVTATDQRKWYEKISVFSKSPKVKVWLPDGAYAALTLETDTGDVAFHGEYVFLKLDVETDTGDVEGTILSEKFFSVSSHLGDENVPKTRSGGDFEASSDTGDIEIEIAE